MNNTSIIESYNLTIRNKNFNMTEKSNINSERKMQQIDHLNSFQNEDFLRRKNLEYNSSLAYMDLIVNINCQYLNGLLRSLETLSQIFNYYEKDKYINFIIFQLNYMTWHLSLIEE